jgi:hypothetical protein
MRLTIRSSFVRLSSGLKGRKNLPRLSGASSIQRKPLPLTLALSAGLLVLLSASSSSAQSQINADVEYGGGQWYHFQLTNITDTANNQSAFGGIGEVLCIDHNAPNPSFTESEIHTYNVLDSNNPSSIFSQAGGSPRGVDLVNYLFDQYYATLLPDYSDAQLGFQRILWELSADYDGTNASLDLNAGNNTLTNPDAEAMLASLKAANIPLTYRSSIYDIGFLDDVSTSGNYQNMVFVRAASASANAPEPGSLCLLLPAMGALGIVVRRRKK